MIYGLFIRLFRKKAVLARAQAGESAAIAELFDAHVEALYAFVYYRVGRDVELAEEVVQETFSLALARSEQYDARRGSVAAWLTTLSRNVIRDQLRAHRRGEVIAAQWSRIDASLAQMYRSMAEAPLPGEVMELDETRDLVNMAVANLPETYRVALTRKYVEGCSLDALADELGLTPAAAKSLLARARRAFRDAFATLGSSLSEVTT